MGGRVGVSECRYPQTPEESIACPTTVATGDCEQLNMGAENQIQVLQKRTHTPSYCHLSGSILLLWWRVFFEPSFLLFDFH